MVKKSYISPSPKMRVGDKFELGDGRTLVITRLAETPPATASESTVPPVPGVGR